MADVQPERHFLRLHRDILSALCAVKVGRTALRVALAVVRASYGFNEPTTGNRLHVSTLSQICGGLDRAMLRRALRELEDYGILEVVSRGDRGTHKATEYRPVKDWETWAGMPREWSVTWGEKQPSRGPVSPQGYGLTGPQAEDSGVPRLRTQESPIIREIEKREEIPPKPPQGGGSLLLPGVKEAAPKPKRKRASKALDRYAKNPTRAALAVYAHWHSKHPRADERMSPEQNSLIQRLLDGGYSVEDLCSVIDYTHASDWHIRNKNLGLDYCLRAKHVKDRVNAIKEHGSEGAAAPSEATEEHESYNVHQWFESEMSRAARRLELAPEAVTIEWAGRHPLANTVPAWALERAVSNVRKERA